MTNYRIIKFLLSQREIVSNFIYRFDNIAKINNQENFNIKNLILHPRVENDVSLKGERTSLDPVFVAKRVVKVAVLLSQRALSTRHG